MQLGPGYVRGDRFACSGSVGALAELDMVTQAATRALGRGDESSATAQWRVGAGGTLRLLGEPLVLYDFARHRTTTDVELELGATLAYVDVIAASRPFASVATRLRIFAGDRLLVHDALHLTPERLRGAVGSAFFVCVAETAHSDERELAAADSAAIGAAVRHGVRIGIGRPACGGVSVRAVGAGAASVHAALLEVLARVAPRSGTYR
jgi:urease accessory protein UreH